MSKLSLVFLFAILTCPALLYSQGTPPSADEVLKEAYQTAAKEKKNVLVIFHASWCVWCHKMDASMNDPVCKKFFDDNFVIRHLVVDESKDKKNLENPGAEELKTKYYGAGLGIPYWLIFDKDGVLLADSKIRKEGEGPTQGSNSGCPATKEEVDYFVNILKKTTKLTSDQLEVVRNRFRRNE